MEGMDQRDSTLQKTTLEEPRRTTTLTFTEQNDVYGHQNTHSKE